MDDYRYDLRADYESLLQQPADIRAHLGTLYALARSSKSIVELGVRTGLSTTALLLGASESGGIVTSVDVNQACPSYLPLCVSTNPHWTFVAGDDMDPEVAEQLPSAIDLLFIDTSHTYPHTLEELRIYGSRVRAGGAIAFHDWVADEPVRRSAQEWIEETRVDWRGVTTNTDDYGFHVLTR